MNRNLPYGYNTLGAYSLIKLTAKLSETQRNRLSNTYYQYMHFIPLRNGKTRIEGVLHCDYMSNWLFALKDALLLSKIEFLEDQRTDIHQAHYGNNQVC